MIGEFEEVELPGHLELGPEGLGVHADTHGGAPVTAARGFRVSDCKRLVMLLHDRLLEKISKVSLFYFFVLQLAKEAIIKTTERTVPTIIAGNIWSADSLKNL